MKPNTAVRKAEWKLRIWWAKIFSLRQILHCTTPRCYTRSPCCDHFIIKHMIPTSMLQKLKWRFLFSTTIIIRESQVYRIGSFPSISLRSHRLWPVSHPTGLYWTCWIEISIVLKLRIYHSLPLHDMTSLVLVEFWTKRKDNTAWNPNLLKRNSQKLSLQNNGFPKEGVQKKSCNQGFDK